MNDSGRDPVGKTLHMLRWFMTRPNGAASVRELSGELATAPSSTHRMLSALVDAGLVAQDSRTSLYVPSLDLFRLAGMLSAQLPFRAIALEKMRSLVNACNETVVLGVYDPSHYRMFLAAKVDSTHPLRYAVDLNEWRELHAGASALAILAFLPENVQAPIIDRARFARLTSRTVVEPYRIRETLAKIRRDGYALTKGERIDGAVGIAAPIFAGDKDVIGDICLTIPELRHDPANEDGLVALVVECARAISNTLAGAGDSLPAAAREMVP